MIRAVVDTNIIVSGLLFGGLPLKIITLALERRFIWVVSSYLLEELERVLGHKKFGLLDYEIKILLIPIIEISEVIIPTTTLDIVKRCPAGNRVLECALDGKCSRIVTGDRRDLLSIKNFQNIEIVTARHFLQQI